MVENQPILDPGGGDRIRRVGGESLWHRMVEMFLANAPARMAGLDDGSDLKTMEQAAHSLKSSAGNLGASRLQYIAERIEVAAGAGDSDACAELCAEARRVYDDTRQALERERGGEAP